MQLGAHYSLGVGFTPTAEDYSGFHLHVTFSRSAGVPPVGTSQVWQPRWVSSLFPFKGIPTFSMIYAYS
jgi:hypothetical protein